MRDTDLLQLALEVLPPRLVVSSLFGFSIPPLSEAFKHLPGVFLGSGIVALAGCLSKKKNSLLQLISWFSPLTTGVRVK